MKYSGLPGNRQVEMFDEKFIQEQTEKLCLHPSRLLWELPAVPLLSFQRQPHRRLQMSPVGAVAGHQKLRTARVLSLTSDFFSGVA